MKSIYFKLFLSYVFLMMVILLPFAHQLYTYNKTLSEYSEVVENLVLVEDIPILNEELVNNYGKLYTNIDNPNFNSKHLELTNELNRKFEILDKNITNENSVVLFRGLYNASLNIVDSVNKGIILAQNGDLEQASVIYDNVIRADSFLEDNTAKLLFKEIGALQEFKTEMDSVIRLIFITSLAFFVSSIVIGVLMSLYFSKIMTNPISVLSHLSDNVSKGKFNIKVPKELVNRKDEIGLLSKALEEMFSKITSQIKKLESNQRDLARQNIDLEKTNKLMVNREIKMIKLKKEVKSLKNK